MISKDGDEMKAKDKSTLKSLILAGILTDFPEEADLIPSATHSKNLTISSSP